MTTKKHRRQRLALKRENRHSVREKYTLVGSPLYKIGGPRKLAALMGLTIERIREIARRPDYHCFDEQPKKEGKSARHIQDPRGDTQVLHYRFAKFLNRIKRPAFLHSATRGRSYISNAYAHRGIHPVVCTDIEKFYENTTRTHVKGFLLRELQWPIDLATTMADALTIDGHLPTGSAVSPVLSYFAHRQMFAKIEAMCIQRGCTLTLFVDDITISGPHASMAVLRDIKRVLLGQGLRAKKEKDKSGPAGSAMIITGAVREGHSLRIRNEHRRSIVELLARYDAGDVTVESRVRSKIVAVKCVDSVDARPFESRFARLRSAHLNGTATISKKSKLRRTVLTHAAAAIGERQPS